MDTAWSHGLVPGLYDTSRNALEPASSSSKVETNPLLVSERDLLLLDSKMMININKIVSVYRVPLDVSLIVCG